MGILSFPLSSFFNSISSYPTVINSSCRTALSRITGGVERREWSGSGGGKVKNEIRREEEGLKKVKKG